MRGAGREAPTAPRLFLRFAQPSADAPVYVLLNANKGAENEHDEHFERYLDGY